MEIRISKKPLLISCFRLSVAEIVLGFSSTRLATEDNRVPVMGLDYFYIGPLLDHNEPQLFIFTFIVCLKRDLNFDNENNFFMK